MRPATTIVLALLLLALFGAAIVQFVVLSSDTADTTAALGTTVSFARTFTTL